MFIVFSLPTDSSANLFPNPINHFLYSEAWTVNMSRTYFMTDPSAFHQLLIELFLTVQVIISSFVLNLNLSNLLGNFSIEIFLILLFFLSSIFFLHIFFSFLAYIIVCVYASILCMCSQSVKKQNCNNNNVRHSLLLYARPYE